MFFSTSSPLNNFIVNAFSVAASHECFSVYLMVGIDVRAALGVAYLSPQDYNDILDRIYCDEEDAWTLLQELSDAGDKVAIRNCV